VDLLVKPVTPGGQRRLISQFLGLQPSGHVVVATPRTAEGAGVFLPESWSVGMSFELGGLWLQTHSTVSGHCAFPLYPTRRVEATVLAPPAEMRVSERRRQVRQKVDPRRPIFATIWPAEGIESGAAACYQVGRLADWSQTGLGVRVFSAPALKAGQAAAVRLDKGLGAQCLLVRGVVRHVDASVEGGYRVGIGEVTIPRPGEAPELMEFLAAARA
jgi:hypothetical protein